ncbi:locus notch homolog 1-like isoform X1 [Octopus vulgaris]|uniref:Delta-like protein n=1 Tax=Octopus vulgaris TaxID=6645 RepID=A0AA36B5T9_OCTVU|nr:locus notch homolog 1-like isoform X1 [Octopus vulgaris]
MLQLTSSLLLCTLVAVTISPIVANYVIDVKLIKFENFNRLLANRRQCSNFGTVQCQTSLSLCARPDSGTVTCEYGTRDMGVIGDNIINLNTSYVGTIRNPITLLVNQPFQKFTISFTTKDNQELMDQYDYNSRYNMPHKSIEEASYQMVTTPGQYGTGSQLTYQIRTYCSQGYYGPSCAVRCEIPIIEQVRFMCNNNGKRVCKPGFSGSFCNLNADVCRSSPCKNGATCTVQGSMFKCYCIPGYTGQYCNKVLSACSSITCLNGGTCVNSATLFVLVDKAGLDRDANFKVIHVIRNLVLTTAAVPDMERMTSLVLALMDGLLSSPKRTSRVLRHPVFSLTHKAADIFTSAIGTFPTEKIVLETCISTRIYKCVTGHSKPTARLENKYT